MTPESQQAAVAFLASPATHGGAHVERIDTHSAIVFLAGERALKLKRAVRFDYLDFLTPERRREACEAEVLINRRTAPSLYRGVVAVTRDANGTLALDGSGVPIDWCVDMARFHQEGLLDRVAARGALDLALAEKLADAVSRFHLAAARRRYHGGYACMRWVIDTNADGFEEHGHGILDPDRCRALTAAARRELGRLEALLDRRRAYGLVRQCHGDLHLRNIVLLDGVPTLFDAIEFNDEIACVDVFYDLAFLLMDLWYRGLRRHANVVLNRYLVKTLDFEGLATLPLFLSCRAAILAKTSATAASVQEAAGERRRLEVLARDYLALAGALLRPTSPLLVAIGGFSGAGKSTLALSVAPAIGSAPGAVVLRSDEIRKELLGVAPLKRLPASAYAPQVSSQVYLRLAERAQIVLQARHTVVADAVFARGGDRAAIEAVAMTTSAPFVGLWLDAPERLLMTRVAGRPADVSDADVRVVRQQLQSEPGPIAWARLAAGRGASTVLAEAHDRIGWAASSREADPTAGGVLPRSA